MNLHEGNSLLGLLVEQGNALLEALLVSLPRLQQLGLLCTVSILDCSRHIHVLHKMHKLINLCNQNAFSTYILFTCLMHHVTNILCDYLVRRCIYIQCKPLVQLYKDSQAAVSDVTPIHLPQ